jgi:hypothetical protein
VGPDAEEEEEVGGHDREALEPHDGVAGVGLGREAEGGGVVRQEEVVRSEGEGVFEEGEEGRVVQRPFRGGLEVPCGRGGMTRGVGVGG